MSIAVKSGGAYANIVGVFHKRAGTYEAVQGIYCKRGGVYERVDSQVVGGLVVGAAGATGSMYEGFTLRWGDDFDRLDLLGPASPRGKYWTTRVGGAGARGQDTTLGTQYDTDPLMTGHNDSNRGAPVGYSNMSVSNSVLTLQARTATTLEKAHMQGTRAQVTAQISTIGEILFYPGAAGTGDVIVEANMGWSTGNPAGWHATFWAFSAAPAAGDEKDEWDFESNSSSVYLQRNVKTAGVSTSTNYGNFSIDGAMHLMSYRLNKSSPAYYKDGALLANPSVDANSKGLPQFVFLTSHVYNSTFYSDTYSESAWTADANGAALSVDYLRVWSRSGLRHYRPLTSLSDQYVAYGGSITITLPSKVILWGNADAVEYVQAVYNEENEPGVTHSTVYQQFPSGVTYNESTRELTVNITSGNAGRINFVVAPYDTAGSTCQPLRFAVNVGPRLSTTALTLTAGQAVSFDLYAACDCGVLTTNGTARTKTISVSGLGASGLSYSDSTGLLTGTAVAGTYTLAVTITNSVGQVATGNLSVTISATTGYAYESITSGAVGWFDASDASTITASSGAVSAWANKRSGQGDLTKGGTAAVTVTAAAINGRNVISLARDVTSTSTIARLSSTSTSALSQAFQGSDTAWTVISVYRPTDTNTGFVWAASDTVSSTASNNVALVRRTSTASSIRKSVIVASAETGAADVAFGTGEASGVLQITAAKHTGTAVTIWENSTTATVTASAQDSPTMGTGLIFRIGAAAAAGTPAPYLSSTACAMDVCEILVWAGTVPTEAQIQQAITDLASKWGKTLS